MEKRFRALRVIATIWKVLAWIGLVAGVILSFAAGFATTSQFAGFPPIMTLVMGLFLTTIYFISLYVTGESIYLFLDIEENTRETSLLLRGRKNSTPLP